MPRSWGRARCLASTAVLALSLVGCRGVDKCVAGEVGCVDGPPDEAGQCKFDLVARGNVCLTPAGAKLIDDAGLLHYADGALAPDTGPRPAPTMPCGKCAANKTCATDTKSCVDFCGAPSPVPGSGAAPEPIRCGGEIKEPESGERYTLTFAEACESNCQLACRSREWFCKKGCEKDACKKPEVQADCHARCDKASDPLSCVQSLCNDTRASGCSTREGFCAEGDTADCTKAICTNSCASTAYDGLCDDGDLLNASFAGCAWGTDCADCGPREGEDTSRNRKQGEPCSLQEQCTGSSPDFSKNDSFCAAVVPGKDWKRCVLDCSYWREPCPVGTTCTSLKGSDGKVVKDFNGVEGHACLPDACL